MRLTDEIAAARATENGHVNGSAKWCEIRGGLEQLAEQHGRDEAGPYVVVLTAFHGGGTVSRHATATRALERARRERVSDCVCGCTAVIVARNVDELPDACDVSSPYELAR